MMKHEQVFTIFMIMSMTIRNIEVSLIGKKKNEGTKRPERDPLKALVQPPI